MNLTLVFGILLVCAVAFMLVAQSRAKAALAKAKKASDEKQALETKLDSSRKDLTRAKEELNRKTLALNEARETAKKKLRREAKDDSLAPESSIGNEQEEKWRAAVSAMEAQLRSARDELARAEQSVQQRLEQDYQRRQIHLQQQIKQLEDEVSKTHRELQKKKRPPKIGDLTLNLETLPEDVVSELARLHRSSEQHEKLYAVAEGKVKMAREKYNELQRKYFAVCRELALIVAKNGASHTSDQDAKNIAESIINLDKGVHESS